MSDLTPNTNILVGAYNLLMLMTKKYPPISRHAHSITLVEQNRLQLNLVHVTPCEKVVFTVEDLAKPIPALVAEITKLVPKEPPPSAA